MDKNIRNGHTEKASAIKEIAEAVCLGTGNISEHRARHCIHILDADFSVIRNAHNRICKKDSPITSGIAEWLSDNFYLIENEYGACRKALSTNTTIPFANGLPRISRAFADFCNYADFPLDSECIDTLINEIDSSFTLSVAELFLSPFLVRLSLIASCRHILETCEGKLSSHPDADIRKHTAIFSDIIKSLQYTSVHCFDNSILTCRLAKILSDDPCHAFDNMTDSSKMLYLNLIGRKAKKQGISEEEYAHMLLKQAEAGQGERSRHIGEKLFEQSESQKYLYFLFSAGIPLLLTVALMLLSPLFVLALPPLLEAAVMITDYVFSKVTLTLPLPRMKLNGIPDDSPVLIVITSLLCGEPYDGELFEKLECIFRANSGKNVYFGLLADIPDSNTAKAPGDENTLNHAYGRTEALCRKYGNHFILFERRRSYSKSEEVFMGWERKRGAVTELVKFLKGDRDTTFSERSVAGASEILGNTKIRYVITLDSDTNLGTEAAQDMCSAMLHPLAKPYIDSQKGIVTKGYGIMQPRCVPELSAAGATAFSGIMCGEGGSNIYSGACFDAYQSVFGSGIFCGKGIFDTDAFYEVIIKNNTFPEDRILSHDSLEGAKLRSALMSDTELTDGFPKNQISYLKRLHRWIRGDIANLAYLFPRISFGKGIKKRNFITPLSKYKLLSNGLRALTPIFSFSCIFIAMTVSDPLTIGILIASSLLYIAVPFLCSVISQLSNIFVTLVTRRFFAKGVTTGVRRSFFGMLFTLSMLPSLALCSADAIIRALYRMASGKKLLQWQTSALSDKSTGGLLLYVQKNIICAFSGFLLLAFSPAGFLRLIAILWFAFPVVSYHVCHEKTSPTRKSTFKSDENLEKSRKYAADIWRFFHDNVTEEENFLPPDNISLAPLEATAHRTSPTNIGLYLLSVLCAADFGFITPYELESRIRSTLRTMGKMQRFNGHFFNWYDTETLNVLPPYYISTVDSGNLHACLITLINGLDDYVSESTSLLEVIKALKNMEKETDYSFLYNQSRSLLSLGAEIRGDGSFELSSNCYDLMMSEARTASYILCAKREVPKKHWTSLARTLVSADGYIGLSSWTGTAFEYFMPHIFLPLHKRSLQGEAMHFAFREQSKRAAYRKGKRIFGISESGYCAFDAHMNYRYRAFGIPSLALKSGQENDLVISPYSTFLALCSAPKKAFANLEAMYSVGLYGKYGFYEAADFTEGRSAKNGSVVKSYMSHHLGMSLCALCNNAFGNILQKRFMSDSAMKSASGLLEEQIPVNAVIRKVRRKKEVPQKPPVFSPDGKIYTNPDIFSPKAMLLSNGHGRIILSDTGHTELSAGDTLINYCDREKLETTDSLFTFALFSGEVVSSSPLPLIKGCDAEYSVKANSGYLCRNARIPGLCEFSESFTLYRADSTVFSVLLELQPKIRNSPTQENIPEFAVCFTPVIQEKKTYLSHISFSSLFVSCEFIQSEKILLYKRKKRAENEKDMYLAAALSDKSADFEFYTRQEDCFSTPLDCTLFGNIFENNGRKNQTGALIRPYCKIKTTPCFSDGKYSAELLLCSSADRKKAIDSILAAREKSFYGKSVLQYEISDKLCSGAGTGFYGAEKSPSPFEKILSGIFSGKHESRFFRDRKLPYYGIGSLWEKGVSGDLPIAVLSLVSAQLTSKLEKYIRAAKLLRLCGVKFDLCIIYTEKERYSAPVYHEILNLISECDCSELLSAEKGGIFLVDRSLHKNSADALSAIASIKTDILYESVEQQKSAFSPKIKVPMTTPVLSADILPKKPLFLTSRGGYFTENGFTVCKDREFKAPFSHILSGRVLSCLVTHNSLGYTWVSNALSRRITPFRDNPLSDMNGERILLEYAGGLYDLCAMSRYAVFLCGKAEYIGYAAGVKFRVTVCVSEKTAVKHADVQLTFPKGSTEEGKLMYLTSPIMGCHSSEGASVQYSFCDGVLVFRNPFSEFFGAYYGFITAIGKDTDTEYITDKKEILSDTPDHGDAIPCACAVLRVGKAPCGEYSFMLGACREKTVSPKKIIQLALAEKSRNAVDAFAKSMIPEISILPLENSDKQKAYSVLFGNFLPYQTAFGRFYGRSGFYQSSGAFGFRDQLQDCLCLMYSSPETVKSHIYRCCTRQFPEGDVLHWWHECDKSSPSDIVCRGVRTMCSDDYIWLAYVTAEYFIFTAERDFLCKKIHFADGEKLLGADIFLRDKYIEVKKSKESDTVYGHCKRALDRAIQRTGTHGLPLIGSCDWCDGYSNVGNGNDGESVWLGMFLCAVLEKFCILCRKMSDSEAEERYVHARLSLASAIEKHGYSDKEGQYIRAYFADGEMLGSLSSDECKTDLLPQCFAPLTLSLPPDRIYTTAKNSFLRLFDSELSIYKLFSPPFDTSKQNPGYVKGYVEGIRENGGQYTHAAVWGAMGLCESADILYRNKDFGRSFEIREMAKKAVNAQNTVLRCMGYLGEKAKSAYFAEPFWLCGDIYSNRSFPGRAGWSLYTGSASWYYILILKYVFGVHLTDMSTENPKFEIVNDTPFTDPEICCGATLSISPFEGCRYSFVFSEGEAPHLLLDNEEAAGKIKFEKGDHTVMIIRPYGNI